MILIRQNCFETNSSTTHGISMWKPHKNKKYTEDSLKYGYTISEDGIWLPTLEEWYDNWFKDDIMGYFIDKVKYAYVNGHQDEAISILKKYAPWVKEVILPDGIEQVHYDGIYECSFDSWLIAFGIDLEEFIIKPAYFACYSDRFGGILCGVTYG